MSAIENKTIAVALMADWMKNPIGPDTVWPDGFENATRVQFQAAVKLAMNAPDLAPVYRLAARLLLDGFVSTGPDESNWLCDSFTESEIMQAFDLMHEAEAV